MAQKKEFNPETPVGIVCNHVVTTAPADSSAKDIASLFSDKVTFIPLLDRSGKRRAIAREGVTELRIGSRVVAEDTPSFIIAEIGINHNGSLDLAKRMIDLAAEAGADCAKFQMRHMSTMYRNKGNPNDAREDL